MQAKPGVYLLPVVMIVNGIADPYNQRFAGLTGSRFTYTSKLLVCFRRIGLGRIPSLVTLMYVH
jgi:hypothetical protein